MMIAGTGVHLLSFLVGAVLFLASMVVWIAVFIPAWRRIVEAVWMPGKDLFAINESYSSLVFYLRWWGFVLGILLFFPAHFLVDLLLAAAAILIWRHIASKAKKSLEGS